ncbi:hypothetical protein DFJ77DRAFT_475719 [Powellomyces hirtus]|nr:hypothetical protein DFJ77DRAFT_475719 [Powellomyces hirtus]
MASAPAPPQQLNDGNEHVYEVAFGVVGVVIMLCNFVYAVKILVDRKNRYNAFLLVAVVLMVFAQICVLVQSIVLENRSREYMAYLDELEDNDVNRQVDGWYLRDLMLNLQRFFNACFAVSTCGYLLLIQMRFRVLKTIMPYSRYWDYAFVVATLALWGVAMLYFNLITYQGSTFLSGFMASVWNVYLLGMDQVLCATFLYKLSDFQIALGQTSSADARSQITYRRITFLALVLLAIVSWVCFGIFVWSHMVSDKGMQSILFRIASGFSSLTFSAALAFVYAVKRMMTRTMSSRQVSRPNNSRSHQKLDDPTGSSSTFVMENTNRDSTTNNKDSFALNANKIYPPQSNSKPSGSPATSQYQPQQQHQQIHFQLPNPYLQQQKQQQPPNPYGVPPSDTTNASRRSYFDNGSEHQSWRRDSELTSTSIPLHSVPARLVDQDPLQQQYRIQQQRQEKQKQNYHW